MDDKLGAISVMSSGDILPPVSEHEANEVEGGQNTHNRIPEATQDTNLFVLCMHCIRMIYVHSTNSTPVAEIAPTSVRVSLVTTSCRACKKRSKVNSPFSTSIKISPDVIRHTHLHDCACKIIGEDVEILADERAITYVPVEEIADKMDIICRVQGVNTTESVLRKLNETSKEDLLLSYMPGAFL